jgi:hypothetical protein
MTRTPDEHDDDLEPTVSDDDIEAERYEVDDDAAESGSDVKNSWERPQRGDSSASDDDRDADSDDRHDDADDSI